MQNIQTTQRALSLSNLIMKNCEEETSPEQALQDALTGTIRKLLIHTPDYKIELLCTTDGAGNNSSSYYVTFRNTPTVILYTPKEVQELVDSRMLEVSGMTRIAFTINKAEDINCQISFLRETAIVNNVRIKEIQDIDNDKSTGFVSTHLLGKLEGVYGFELHEL
jgi:hypothetical protein